MTDQTPRSLDRLFDVLVDEDPFGSSEEDEIEHVRAGDKAVALYTMPRANLDAGSEYLLELTALATGAGLSLCTFDVCFDERYPEVYVFVGRANELWRGPALLALRRTARAHGWSEAFEAQQSALLGYSPDMIARWLERDRARQLGWPEPTVHVLMTSACQRWVRDHGSACLPRTDEVDEPIVCFAHRARLPIRADASTACAPAVLGRAALARPVFNEWMLAAMLSTEDDVVQRVLSATEVDRFNQALRSKIQLHTGSGWPTVLAGRQQQA